jgi:hypothetical protein
VLEAADRRLTGQPDSIDAAIAVDHVARTLARDLLPGAAAGVH